MCINTVLRVIFRPLRKWIGKHSGRTSEGPDKSRGFKPQQLFPDADGKQKGSAGTKGRNVATSPTARGKSKQPSASPKPNKKKPYQLLVSRVLYMQ